MLADSIMWDCKAYIDVIKRLMRYACKAQACNTVNPYVCQTTGAFMPKPY